MGIAGTVTVDMSRFSTVEAEVAAASTIAFCKSDMAIRLELCRRIARGGCRVRSPIVVRSFLGVVVPTVPGLVVDFCGSHEVGLQSVRARGMTTIWGSWLERMVGTEGRL